MKVCALDKIMGRALCSAGIGVAGLLLVACGGVVNSGARGENVSVSEAAVIKFLKSVGPSPTGCLTESDNGIGEWNCVFSGRGELTLSINASGQVESEGVGIPAPAGCCVAVERR